MSASPSPAPEPRFAAWAPVAAFFVAFSATTIVVVFMQAIAALDGEGDDALSPGGSLIATFVQNAFLLIAAFAFARVTIARVTVATFGWRRFAINRRLWLVPVLFLVFYVFLQVFGQLVDPEANDELATDLGARDSTAALIGVAVLVGIVAPFVEEIFFRGFLFPALSGSPLGWIGGAVISGTVFGLVHAAGTDAVFLLPLAVFGVVLAVLYHRTGSLLPSMGVHAFNNGLALGSTLDWSVQGTVASCLLAPIIVVSIAWAVAPE